MMTFFKNKYNFVNLIAITFSLLGVICSVIGLNNVYFAYAGLIVGMVGLLCAIVTRIKRDQWGINEWYARVSLTIIVFATVAICVLFGVSIALDYIDGKQIDDPLM